MQVKDIMTSRIAQVETDVSIAHAALRMKDSDVGMLPVMSGGRVVGVLSDRDITIRSVAKGMDAESTTVRQVMTGGPIWCKASDDIETAAGIMKQKQVRRLLVSNEEGKPVGILSIGDLAANQETRNYGCEVLAAVCADIEEQPAR